MDLDLTEYNLKLRWFSNKSSLEESFKTQCELFEKTRNSKIDNKFNTDMIFKENTLIHGTSFDYDKLLSIKKLGILSGDFIGIEEKFEETPLCADFFRLKKDMSLFEFYATMNGTREWVYLSFLPIKPLGEKPIYKQFIDVSNCRLPFLNTDTSKNNIAFIINGDNEILKQFQEYDYYRNLSPYSLMSKVVNTKITDEFYPPEMSSILLGIPSNLFTAIVVGSEIEKDKNKMDFLKTTFEDLIILSADAKILHIPKQDKTYYNIESIKNNFDKELKNFAKNVELEYKPQSNFVKRIEKVKSNLFEQDYSM